MFWRARLLKLLCILINCLYIYWLLGLIGLLYISIGTKKIAQLSIWNLLVLVAVLQNVSFLSWDFLEDITANFDLKRQKISYFMVVMILHALFDFSISVQWVQHSDHLSTMRFWLTKSFFCSLFPIFGDLLAILFHSHLLKWFYFNEINIILKFRKKWGGQYLKV